MNKHYHYFYYYFYYYFSFVFTIILDVYRLLCTDDMRLVKGIV